MPLARILTFDPESVSQLVADLRDAGCDFEIVSPDELRNYEADLEIRAEFLPVQQAFDRAYEMNVAGTPVYVAPGLLEASPAKRQAKSPAATSAAQSAPREALMDKAEEPPYQLAEPIPYSQSIDLDFQSPSSSRFDSERSTEKRSLLSEGLGTVREAITGTVARFRLQQLDRAARRSQESAERAEREAASRKQQLEQLAVQREAERRRREELQAAMERERVESERRERELEQQRERAATLQRERLAQEQQRRQAEEFRQKQLQLERDRELARVAQKAAQEQEAQQRRDREAAEARERELALAMEREQAFVREREQPLSEVHSATAWSEPPGDVAQHDFEISDLDQVELEQPALRQHEFDRQDDQRFDHDYAVLSNHDVADSEPLIFIPHAAATMPTENMRSAPVPPGAASAFHDAMQHVPEDDLPELDHAALAGTRQHVFRQAGVAAALITVCAMGLWAALANRRPADPLSMGRSGQPNIQQQIPFGTATAGASNATPNSVKPAAAPVSATKHSPAKITKTASTSKPTAKRARRTAQTQTAARRKTSRTSAGIQKRNNGVRQYSDLN